MAGISKEQQLALRVYNSLLDLACPSVDGLYLSEANSMQELLCTPSLHRTDILKWICVRICPSLRDNFSSIKSSETEEVAKEITRFGHEMLLCKADDQDLIKGFATPLRQLLFLEQLLSIARQQEISDESSEIGSITNADLLKELMSPDHLTEFIQLMNPVCVPWSAYIQEYLNSVQAAQAKSNGNESHCVDSGYDQQNSVNLVEATALLQSTLSTLEELRKECEFLQLKPSGPAVSLSPCALKVAISDMAQLMTAFSQVYKTDFKGYSQRAPPVLNPNARVFQSVHQLLHCCNMELEALQQLSKTASTLTEIVRQLQTDRRFWINGEKHTLSNQLEALKNRFNAFLSLHR